jgi:hypothetical protein
MIFAPHAASSAPSSTPSFEALLTASLGVCETRDYALDLGIDETALIRYANGAVSMYRRREIQHVLLRNSWSRDYVVDYVKSKRVKQVAA